MQRLLYCMLINIFLYGTIHSMEQNNAITLPDKQTIHERLKETYLEEFDRSSNFSEIFSQKTITPPEIIKQTNNIIAQFYDHAPTFVDLNAGKSYIYGALLQDFPEILTWIVEFEKSTYFCNSYFFEQLPTSHQ